MINENYLIGKYNSSEILPGPEKVAKRLLQSLNEKELNPVFLTYFFKDCSSSNIITRAFGKRIVTNNPQILKMGMFRIVICLFSKKPDIIHIITFERFILPILFLKKIFKSKVVYTVHGIVRDEINIPSNKLSKFSKFKDRFLERMLFNKSDYLVFLSEQSKKNAERYYNLNHSNTCIIPNGVSSNFFVQNNSALPKDNLKIVFYNGIDDSIDRGINVLIDVLDKSLVKIDLFVIGKAENINANNISIHFVKPMDELALVLFLKDKNIFLNSVTPTTFSLMSLEAMAAGLMVIISDQTGLSKYIKNGVNGFVYKSENPSELVKILNDLHTGLIDCELIRKNAQQTCRELNWDNIAGRYVELYNKLLS